MHLLGFGEPPAQLPDGVQTQSFCSQMGQAMCGVAVGFAMFIGAIFLLGWNEFNYVRNDTVIRTVKEKTFVYTGCVPDVSRDGQGVYVSCPFSNLHNFAAVEFQNSLKFADQASPAGTMQGIWFEARSQIWQWTEDKTCTEVMVGGQKQTTCKYYYKKAWVSNAIDSESFYCLSGGRTPSSSTNCFVNGVQGSLIEPRNSGSIPPVLQGLTLPTDRSVALGGGFHPDPRFFAGRLFGARAVGLDANTSSPPDGVMPGKKVFFKDGQAYFSATEPTTSNTTLGDVRTFFTVSNVRKAESKMSIVSMQSGGADFELNTWVTGMKGTMSEVSWAYEGTKTLDWMITQKMSENSSATWFLRFLGWLMMFLGLQLITGPIALMPHIIPCIGDCLAKVVGCILCIVNFCMSASWALLVIAIAWIAARPLVGICIFIVAAALFAGAFFLHQKFGKKDAREYTQEGGTVQMEMA